MKPRDPRSRIGTRVADRYRVESELSRGGMGIVFKAVQEPLEREIALKIMLPGPAADQTLRRRFIQEAQALSRTVHPNIVTIFDFGEVDDGALFIAMELVAGQNLRELLQGAGRVGWQDSLAMAIGATRALVTAHAAGITHRDLKPDNIMLVGGRWRAEDVKLLDFGLARTLGEGEQLTQINVIPGTPHYIAPERVSSRVEDPRSDLYALGTIWFELLTGKLPFQGDTVGAILLAHVQRQVPTMSQVAPAVKVPADVERVVARLMAKNPDERWATSRALLDELEELERKLSGAPRATTAPVAAARFTAPPPPSAPRAQPSRWTSSAANRADGVGPVKTPEPVHELIPEEAPTRWAAPAAPRSSSLVKRPPAVTPPAAPQAVVSRPVSAPGSGAAPRPAGAPAPAGGDLVLGDERITIEEQYDPARRHYTCAAIFRGRLLRKVELEVPELADARRQAWQASARADFTAGIRALLARTRTADELAPPQESPEARMFFFALEAYLGGDRATALRTIEGLRLALPNDVRLANTHKKLLLELESAG